MTKFARFADDAVSVSIGKFTVENGTDRIALYGSLDLTRDRRGSRVMPACARHARRGRAADVEDGL